MKELINKNGLETKIFAKTIEDEALMQIDKLCNSDAYSNNKIRIMPDCHAGSGCTIGTTIRITDRVVPNTVGVDISCLDCNTEILTENGWIKISEYKDGKILQFEPSTNTGMFITPKEYIKKPCDYFYHFLNSKGLDQMISEEHNMLVYSGHKTLKYKKQKPFFFINKKNLDKGYYRFNTCFNIISKGLDLSDDIIRVDIMVQADGRIREYKNYNFVELHFKKERKIIRARSLLSKANIKFNEYIDKRGSTFMSFHVPKFINKDLSKYYRANFEQLEIVSRESLLWDGYLGYRSYYCSTNIKNADVIQYAFIATNNRASLYFHKSNNIKFKDFCNVIPTKNKYVGYNVNPIKIKSIDGFKYCFNTDTGYFICRRNGYTFITGNCGMLCINMQHTLDNMNMKELDEIINYVVPCGFNIHDYKIYDASPLLRRLNCKDIVDIDFANRSLGTLGGGNHFIEVDIDDEGNKYLVIHSGSRNLGVRVCKFYQEMATSILSDRNKDINELVNRYKREGRQSEISEALKSIPKKNIDKDLAYLEGENMKSYIHDINILGIYARLNRCLIANSILKRFDKRIDDYNYSMFETLHNYIDTNEMILRKGAVSAKLGERLIIPMNMRDGSLICIGKGNEDWNYSAPHGAGRLMSRKKAKEILSMDDYINQMKDISSTSICESTIDEAPMAYKPMEEIIGCIKDTVEIDKIIKPIYNFKAK